ncbi:MAG: hypothetical protein KDA41_01910 [Planctomycetales bacterium]|nr:hypothetical protein [Planctomycetales bacterium]
MAKKAATRKTTRRKKPSKRAAILAYMEAHPAEGASAVAAAVTSQGIKVSAQYVSNVKASLKRGKKGAAGGRKAGVGTTPSQDVKQAGQMLVEAIDLVMKAGYKEARALVELAGDVVSRVSDRK